MFRPRPSGPRGRGSCSGSVNAANEVAVNAFLQGKLPFTGIASIVEATLATGLEGDLATIDAVFAVDQRARQQAHDLLAKGSVFKN